MIKNKKSILIIVIFLVIIFLIINCTYYFLNKKNYKNTVFLGSSTKVKVTGNLIKVYNEDAKIIKQKVKIYFFGKFIDGYVSTVQGASSGVENSYVVYNEEGSLLIPKSSLIAHTDDLSIKVKNSISSEISDREEINKFAKANNVILENDMEFDYITLDIIDDESGENEYIYSVGLIKDENEYDSFVFLKKDNKYVLIDRIESDYDDLSNISLQFSSLIDFNNDGKYEYVLNKAMSPYGPNYYELYNFDGKSFTKIGGE